MNSAFSELGEPLDLTSSSPSSLCFSLSVSGREASCLRLATAQKLCQLAVLGGFTG